MPRFEICIVESREHFFEIEAADEHEAQLIAEDLQPGDATRDAHREEFIDYIKQIEGDD